VNEAIQRVASSGIQPNLPSNTLQASLIARPPSPFALALGEPDGFSSSLARPHQVARVVQPKAFNHLLINRLRVIRSFHPNNRRNQLLKSRH
jgi:hypothetical protein